MKKRDSHVVERQMPEIIFSEDRGMMNQKLQKKKTNKPKLKKLNNTEQPMSQAYEYIMKKTYIQLPLQSVSGVDKFLVQLQIKSVQE